MARRKPILPQLLLLLVLLAVLYYFYRRGQIRFSPRGERHHAAEHRREPRESREPRSSAAPEQRSFSQHAAKQPENCSAAGVACSSQYFADWKTPGDSAPCRTVLRNGYPEPDPACTPGGANPSVTLATLRNPAWRTGCVRNCESSESQKHIVYKWYGLTAPRNNNGQTQVCELDHLVPLEIGGADGLGNIWPQCGPSQTELDDRYFKIKDRVENYLAEEVRNGSMSLSDAQHGIAKDWTAYLPAANAFCQHSGKC